MASMSVTRESVNGKKIHHSQHLPTGCNLPRIEHQGRTFLLYKDLSETRPSKCHRAKKVAEYEMDLIASRRYQPDAEEPAEIDYIMMPVSELPVSAGLGAFLEGEMFQQIQVPASSVPAGAEFGIYVSGDSMEPRYHNGQIVWVKRCEELECGDIGIFVYDDCGYLKKYDEHTPDKSQAEFLTDSYGVVHNQPVLVSLNTKYSPILISPEQRFEVVGKVLN